MTRLLRPIVFVVAEATDEGTRLVGVYSTLDAAKRAHEPESYVRPWEEVYPDERWARTAFVIEKWEVSS